MSGDPRMPILVRKTWESCLEALCTWTGEILRMSSTNKEIVQYTESRAFMSQEKDLGVSAEELNNIFWEKSILYKEWKKQDKGKPSKGASASLVKDWVGGVGEREDLRIILRLLSLDLGRM